MDLTISDIKKFKELSFGSDTFNSGGNIYQYSDDVLYKIINESFFRDEVERNIDFLLSHDVPSTVKIFDKIFLNDYFFGYSMKYIKNAFTFRYATYLGIDVNVAIGSIKDVFKAVKYLHKNNILIGDSHLDNLMLDNKGNGYLIDLDYMMFPGDKHKFNRLYDIRFGCDDYFAFSNNVDEDNIRLAIGSLSLIFGVDLEKAYRKYNVIDLECLYNKFIKKLDMKSLDDYFSRILNGDSVEYFDDFLNDNYSEFINSKYVRIMNKGLRLKK